MNYIFTGSHAYSISLRFKLSSNIPGTVRDPKHNVKRDNRIRDIFPWTDDICLFVLGNGILFPIQFFFLSSARETIMTETTMKVLSWDYSLHLLTPHSSRFPWTCYAVAWLMGKALLRRPTSGKPSYRTVLIMCRSCHSLHVSLSIIFAYGHVCILHKALDYQRQESFFKNILSSRLSSNMSNMPPCQDELPPRGTSSTQIFSTFYRASKTI